MLSEFADIQPTEGNTSNEVSSKHADGIIAFGDIWWLRSMYLIFTGMKLVI